MSPRPPLIITRGFPLLINPFQGGIYLGGNSERPSKVDLTLWGGGVINPTLTLPSSTLKAEPASTTFEGPVVSHRPLLKFKDPKKGCLQLTKFDFVPLNPNDFKTITMLPISHPTRKPDAAERHTRDSLSQWRGAPQLARSRYAWLRTSCRELSGNYLHLDQANKKPPHCDVRKKDPVHKGCNRQRYAVAISVRVTCSTWCFHFYKVLSPSFFLWQDNANTHTWTNCTNSGNRPCAKLP